MKKTLSVFLILAAIGSAQAQVVVAPTILFLSNQSRFGTFLVMNRSDAPQEVSISFRFGFPESDSLGNLRMQYDDSAMAREHSCQRWLRGFPQSFILDPGRQQVVRLLVTAPEDIPDGEYWTRLITTSSPQARTVDTIRSGITANITFVLKQVTTVIYRKGFANTSVRIKRIDAVPDSTSTNLLTYISRGGNSPFFGEILADVRDSSGKSVYSGKDEIAVYESGFVVKFAVPASDLPKGMYTAEIRLRSQRSDIAGANLLTVPPLDKTFSFSVP